MKDFLDCCIGLGVLLLLVLAVAIAAIFRLPKSFWPWFARLRDYWLGVLTDRVRVDYEQGAIAVLGGLGAALIAWGHETATWGFLDALAAQPFWICATWRARPRQWGMFAMACWYTLVWGYGAWTQWGGV